MKKSQAPRSGLKEGGDLKGTGVVLNGLLRGMTPGKGVVAMSFCGFSLSTQPVANEIRLGNVTSKREGTPQSEHCSELGRRAEVSAPHIVFEQKCPQNNGCRHAFTGPKWRCSERPAGHCLRNQHLVLW